MLASALYGAVMSVIVMLLKLPVGSLQWWAFWIGGGAVTGLASGLISRRRRKKESA